MAGRWYQEELPLAEPGLPNGAEVKWKEPHDIYRDYIHGPTRPSQWWNTTFYGGKKWGDLEHHTYIPYKTR